MNNFHMGGKLVRGAPNRLHKIQTVPLSHQEHD
jgi:hypothetical protein